LGECSSNARVQITGGWYEGFYGYKCWKGAFERGQSKKTGRGCTNTPMKGSTPLSEENPSRVSKKEKRGFQGRSPVGIKNKNKNPVALSLEMLQEEFAGKKGKKVGVVQEKTVHTGTRWISYGELGGGGASQGRVRG